MPDRRSPAAALTAAGRRMLPHGWRDLGLQIGIWFGFVLAYQVARGFAQRSPGKAFTNGLRVLDWEQSKTHHVIELSLQRVLESSRFLSTLAAWTYWNSEFTVVGLALLWIYLRRHESFARFRNAILIANVIGLVGYVVMPTAPPRMFPGLGFVGSDSNGLVQLASNPYAAMPSLHAADALIVGVFLTALVRRPALKIFWLAWPVWVWFCVMATANHFLLDVIAGNLVALVAIALVYSPRVRARIAKLL